MIDKKIAWRTILMALGFLTLVFTSASIRTETTPSVAFESANFTQSITLGETESSFTPLLSKIVGLYLRNHGIHVKELIFRDPSRLPLALEHKVIDLYWETHTFSPRESDDLGIFPSDYIQPRFSENSRALLEPLFMNIMEKLTIEKWMALQYQVDVLEEDVSKVAKQFLVQERLIR